MSAPTTTSEENDVQGISASEAFLGITVLTVWLLLFLGGILIDTGPFRETLQSPGELASTEIASNGMVVLLFYTVTNIAILCCLASVMGAIGRRARLGVDHRPEPLQDNVNPYISALFRGFFIYLSLVSGLLVLTESPFEAPSWQTYLRLAGSLSLFGFVASYNPAIFGGLMFKANSLLDSNGHQTSGSATNVASDEDASPTPPHTFDTAARSPAGVLPSLDDPEIKLGAGRD